MSGIVPSGPILDWVVHPLSGVHIPKIGCEIPSSRCAASYPQHAAKFLLSLEKNETAK